ncbi:MAG: DUF167 domain-containing protein [Nitrospirales bacterium]
MLDHCLKDTAEGVVLSIYVQPRAVKTEYVGYHGDAALKFRVAAPPLEGAANQALCRYVAKYFGVSKSAVVMTMGAGGRHKRILLKGLSMEQVRQKFACHEE